MKTERLYATPFARIYPYYIAKVEKKGHTKTELDTLIRWLTGYTQRQFEKHLEKETSLEDFYMKAPKLNPNRHLITGVICGVRIEEIKDRVMREIRYMDKIIDELAKGREMKKILRKPAEMGKTNSIKK